MPGTGLPEESPSHCGKHRTFIIRAGVRYQKNKGKNLDRVLSISTRNSLLHFNDVLWGGEENVFFIYPQK